MTYLTLLSSVHGKHRYPLFSRKIVAFVVSIATHSRQNFKEAMTLRLRNYNLLMQFKKMFRMRI
jgi:hypothetical protein